MSRQNRVTPLSALLAVPDRGTLMGNRGCLHDDEGRVVRPYVGKRWIICLLEFKGRRRPLMMPGRYTELFFLDEATALAAGHRPCAECQRERFEMFRAMWAEANPDEAGGPRPPVDVMDAALHRERLLPGGGKATYPARLDSLPDGSMVVLGGGGDAYLVLGRRLLHWTPGGYDAATVWANSAGVRVLTPHSVVRMLAAGYPLDIHDSAQRLLAQSDDG